jgi:hypothetical protein
VVNKQATKRTRGAIQGFKETFLYILRITFNAYVRVIQERQTTLQFYLPLTLFVLAKAMIFQGYNSGARECDGFP